MRLLILGLFILLNSFVGQAAVLMEGEVDEVTDYVESPEFSANQSGSSNINIDEFEMQPSATQGRFGLGLKFLGEVGSAGFHGEARIIDNIAIGASYGFGAGYQTLGLKAIQYFSEADWSFYAFGGFSKWFSGAGSKDKLNKSTPKFFADKFLNAEGRRTGQFSELLIYPGVGAKYSLLSGELSGLALQAELLVLVDVDDIGAGLSGSFGMMYYF